MNTLIPRWEASQKRKREIIALEKIAFNEAKEAQLKLNADKKNIQEQNDISARIEKARQRGIKSAMPNTKALDLTKKGIKASVNMASGIVSFLCSHIKSVHDDTPEKQHGNTRLSSKRGNMPTWHLKAIKER